jgi:hypothetical protein
MEGLNEVDCKMREGQPLVDKKPKLLQDIRKEPKQSVLPLNHQTRMLVEAKPKTRVA